MHQAAQALSLLPPSSPSLSVDHEFAHEATAIHPRATGSDGIFRPTDAARGLASSPLRRGALLGLIVAAHVGGLALLARLADERPLPAELVPIQVALIEAPAAVEPAPAPPPEPVVEPPRPPEPEPPPVVRPPEPAPPPPKPVVKKPTPKPVVKKPAPVTESPTALSAAEEAAPPPPPPPAPAPPAAAPAATAAPATVTAARFDAAYLNNPRPGYPALSRRLREEGQVTLRVLVSPDGQPAQVELRNSSGSERLDRAAREAVARWRFVPARRGDIAIESWVLVPIVFKLQGN
jgi:protein TonB